MRVGALCKRGGIEEGRRENKDEEMCWGCVGNS